MAFIASLAAEEETGGDVEREQDLASHRVHIAHGVGGRNRAKGIRVVDHRWKKVHRLDDGRGLVHAIDGGIIRCAKTDQEVRVVGGFELVAEWAQDLRQFGRADFGCSTGAGGV